MSPLRAAPFAPYCDIPWPWPKPCPTIVNDPVAGTVNDSLTLTAPVGDDSSGTTSAAAIRAAEARTAARMGVMGDDPRYGRRHVVGVTGVTSKDSPGNGPRVHFEKA